MPKMKSKKAWLKRIRVSATGKIKRHHAYMGHLAPNKNHKQKRNLSKATFVAKTNLRQVRDLDQKN